MTRNLKLFLFVIFAAGSLAGCRDKAKDAGQEVYTCPMHPEVIKKESGKCPLCAMDLVKKTAREKKVKVTASLTNLMESPNKIVVSQLTTIRPVRRRMTNEIRVSGVVMSDERQLVAVSARVSGRIEQLFIHASHQPVRKGDKILEIYSPELVTAQRELIYLLKNDPANTGLIAGAREKLSLLGLTSAQIETVKSSDPLYRVTMFSPATGYIQPDENGGIIAVHPGMSVVKGQTLFSVVSNTGERIEFDADQQTAAAISVRDSVVAEPGTAREQVAAVSFIQPFLERDNSFQKVRADLPDGNLYRPGEFISVKVRVTSAQAWWIPVAAKKSLGRRDIAFIKTKGAFHAREIVTGEKSGDWIEVKSGIAPDDSVAVSAQFLADSDSFIQTIE